MKVVAVLLALVAVSVADICNDVAGGRAQATQIKSVIATGLDTVMGDCYPNGDAFSALLNSDACSALFYQGTCYGLKTAAKYADVDVVSYDMLRRGVSDVKSLGHTMCGSVEACYNEVFDAVSECAVDQDYLQGVLDRAVDMYKSRAESQVAEFGASNDNTIMGRLINLAMKRFTDLESVRAFAMENLDDGMIEDAQAGYEAFKAAAADFCDSGCVDQSARFFKMLFARMHGRGCDDASEFCGSCEKNARRFFMSRSMNHALPCCLQDVIEQAIDGAAYFRDAYSGEMDQAQSYLRGAFADQPELIAQAEEAAAAVRAQIDCVASVYEDNKSSCA